jgi:Ca-activated chloride channel family protein
MIFTFNHPQYLYLLLLLPLFIIIHFFSLNNKKKIALKFANFDSIARIQGVDFFSKNVILLFLNVLIGFLLILGLSGLTMHTTMKSSSFSFVIDIDVSGSMDANDFIPTRIAAAKQTAINFVDESPFGIRMGVVSFSGSSYIEQDMTEDKNLLKGVIDRIELSGWGGTDLYEAVITSANLLENEDNKAIVLLSDGQINVGNIEEVIQYSQKKDIIIHAIAMGTPTGGITNYSTISKLDEDTLKSVTYNTGGKYFFVTNGEQLSQAFLSILDLTERKVAIDLTYYLILAAFFLFILVFFLSNTRYMNLI